MKQQFGESSRGASQNGREPNSIYANFVPMKIELWTKNTEKLEAFLRPDNLWGPLSVGVYGKPMKTTKAWASNGLLFRWARKATIILWSIEATFNILWGNLKKKWPCPSQAAEQIRFGKYTKKKAWKSELNFRIVIWRKHDRCLQTRVKRPGNGRSETWVSRSNMADNEGEVTFFWDLEPRGSS